LLSLAALAAGLHADSNSAEAHTAPSPGFKIITVLEDGWYNWDFRSQSQSSSNVDWPVTIVYYINANINKVKDKLKTIENIGSCGSPINARLSEGGSWQWDQDSGLKDDCGTGSDVTEHLRVYADGDDRLYNQFLSYYILGTTHEDDCHEHGVWPFLSCHHHWVGYSEVANNHWDSYSDQVAGWDVYPDESNLDNAASFADLHGSGEDHYVFNNGLATLVVVP